jgi:hypothetical protein
MFSDFLYELSFRFDSFLLSLCTWDDAESCMRYDADGYCDFDQPIQNKVGAVASVVRGKFHELLSYINLSYGVRTRIWIMRLLMDDFATSTCVQCWVDGKQIGYQVDNFVGLYPEEDNDDNDDE